MNPDLRARAQSAYRRVSDALMAELGSDGHWSGELTSSALSTAVATIALGEMDRRTSRDDHRALVEGGLRWLAAHAHPDGGWGDTTHSKSNLSTTALGWAAFGAAGADAAFASTVDRAHGWILRATKGPEDFVPSIEARYGDDRTFSVPIVLTLALSGRLGPRGWSHVRGLPFELAALPQSWFGALRLPVVSYALPALISLGQAIHHHAPSRHPIVRWVRQCVSSRTLNRLEHLQPPNGGFLEATPLTAFVTMSLASMGEAHHRVAQRGAEFLRASVRRDGSWPIDTNLATWVTTLAIKALGPTIRGLPSSTILGLREWLLRQQFRSVHPYTGAAPGGWAWTDLPGGVPDADDTAGALLALKRLGDADPQCLTAAMLGIQWLLNLQNRDGGIPTFCRGWGRLPFDRSAPDLTAHTLQAWRAWQFRLPPALRLRVEIAMARADDFLRTSQRSDGAWVPLWFGNESGVREENPVYGTAQVIQGIGRSGQALEARGVDFMLQAQNPDGGWGGDVGVPSTIEETGLALAALSAKRGTEISSERAISWLVNQLEADEWPAPSPIGLYFARLWYAERLYPLIFTTAALRKFASSTPEK